MQHGNGAASARAPAFALPAALALPPVLAALRAALRPALGAALHAARPARLLALLALALLLPSVSHSHLSLLVIFSPSINLKQSIKSFWFCFFKV